MVDNVTLNPGSSGEVIKTDDDGTAHWQYVKLAYGADNTQTRVEASAPLPVEQFNTVSTNNSTTSTLTAGQDTITHLSFTGDDCKDFTAVSVTIYTDQASSTDGMKFEFSTDNTNWDDTYTFTMTAGETRRFQFPVTARYFRVNYTNGGVNQTAFRVQTILHKQNLLTSIHRVGDNVDPDRSAQLTKTVILAQQAGSGDFIPIDSTTSGNLKVAVEEGVYTPADAESNPTDTIKTADHNMVWNGSTWDRQKGDTTDGTLVNLGNNNDVTIDGSTSIGTDGSAHGASQTGIRAMGTDGTNDQQIATDATGRVQAVATGSVAHDGVDAGNPVKIGARAFQANPSLVANGDRVDIQAGRDGGLIVHPDSPLDGFVNNNASATTTNNTSVIAAQGAGIYTYLTDIIVTNASATDTEVIIKDGTTEKLRISAPANGGAVSVGLRSPIAGTADTAWQFASVDAVTTMYVFMSGFTSRIA